MNERLYSLGDYRPIPIPPPEDDMLNFSQGSTQYYCVPCSIYFSLGVANLHNGHAIRIEGVILKADTLGEVELRFEGPHRCEMCMQTFCGPVELDRHRLVAHVPSAPAPITPIATPEKPWDAGDGTYWYYEMARNIWVGFDEERENVWVKTDEEMAQIYPDRRVGG